MQEVQEDCNNERGNTTKLFYHRKQENLVEHKRAKNHMMRAQQLS